MHKGHAARKQLFWIIAPVSMILCTVSLLLSLLITSDFFSVLIGMASGCVTALFKLYLTFHGIFLAVDARKHAKERTFTIAANVLGYILLAAALMLCAALYDASLLGAIDGVFNVYFSSVIYCIFLKDKKKCQ